MLVQVDHQLPRAPSLRDCGIVFIVANPTQWIYVLMRDVFGMLRSTEGWRDGQLVFTGEMTMLGPPRM